MAKPSKTTVEQRVSTTKLSGIYANLFSVNVQNDGIVRIVFKDQAGDVPEERAHIVITSDNARTLGSLLVTLLQQPAAGAKPN